MKIAVTSTGPSLDDNVEVRFGRCPYFLIIDTNTMQLEAIENPNIALGGGAGIQSAQLMSEKGVTTVLTGNCGPNAFSVFGQAGIQVIVGVSGPVRNAVEQFKTGALSSASGPNVVSHYGMGGGRGMGMGIGFGMSNWPTVEQPASPSESDVDPAQERAFLQDQVQILEQQKHQIDQRIKELETGHKLVAVVLSEKCAGCGICVDVCPVGAIEVNQQAVVNDEACTGCAACVSECPNEAIIITQKKLGNNFSKG